MKIYCLVSLLAINFVGSAYAEDNDKLKGPFESGTSFIFKKTLSLRKSNFEDVKPPTKAKILYFIDGKPYQYYTTSKLADAVHLDLENNKELTPAEFEKLRTGRDFCYLTIPTQKEDGIQLSDKTDAYFTYHSGEVYSISRNEKQFTANIKIQDVKTPARFFCEAWPKREDTLKTVGDIKKILGGYIDFGEPTNKQAAARALELVNRLKEVSNPTQSDESAQSDAKEKKIQGDQPGSQPNQSGASKSAK